MAGFTILTKDGYGVINQFTPISLKLIWAGFILKVDTALLASTTLQHKSGFHLVKKNKGI
jgi:hypothetical protein